MTAVDIQQQTATMSQSSTSIPDAQPDPLRQLFVYPEILNSQDENGRFPSEIPDSQDSQLSIIVGESRYHSEVPDQSSLVISRDERIAIQTALKFKIPHSKIRNVLKVTESQIEYVGGHRVTLQKSRAGRRRLFRTQQRSSIKGRQKERNFRRARRVTRTRCLRT